MDKSFFSEKNVTSAYKNLCKNRKKHPANSDIWHFRFHWPQLLAQIINEVKSNNYRLKPMQVVNKRDKTQVVVWSSQDAFVIHLLTLYLQTKLPVHKQCQHVKGHGGGKQSVRELSKTIPRYRFVCRTDIKGYYSNVKKNILLQQIRQYIDDPIVLDLISQFIYYTVENGGLFHTPNKGIARSSPLSPLLGAFHLYCIDEYFSHENIYYIRYMDDFIILTTSRWQLRRAVKKLNKFFNKFSFTQHPDKTFIGKIAKGFDWLGFWFNQNGCVSISPRALANHVTKLHRLYEQVRKMPAKVQALRMVSYIKRYLLYHADSIKRLRP